MLKKKRFKPIITQVKLNPEQAVLTCNCYNTGYENSSTTQASNRPQCNIDDPNSKTNTTNDATWATGGTLS